MVVTPTKPKNSRHIMCIIVISIAPPRFPTEDTVKFKGGNSLCLSHFLVLECTILKKNKRTLKKITKIIENVNRSNK